MDIAKLQDDLCRVKIEFNRNKTIRAGLHLFFWMVLLLFPYLVFPRQENNFSMMFTHNWVPLIQYALLFYLNYLFLSNRYLFQRKYLAYFGINALVIVGFLFLNQMFRDLFLYGDFQNINRPELMPHGPGHSSMPPRGPLPPKDRFFFFKDLFSFIVPVIFSVAVSATENWMKTEALRKESETRHLESELQHLRYQLQPHFFFNSLNNIYSLIEVSPDKAQEAVHSLSKLMRYLLYDTSQDHVDLSQEISFLKKYIQLMELRQTDKTTMSFTFPEILPDNCDLAPLLFIPLIENAFKHGVSATQESHINFTMTYDGEYVVFISENSNFPKAKSDKSGSGIGLINLQKRLELLYPGNYELKYGVSGNRFQAQLKIYVRETGKS